MLQVTTEACFCFFNQLANYFFFLLGGNPTLGVMGDAQEALGSAFRNPVV